MARFSTHLSVARAQGEQLARQAIVAGMREAALPDELILRISAGVEPKLAAANPVEVIDDDDEDDDDFFGPLESKPGLVVIGAPSFSPGPKRKPPTAFRVNAAPVLGLVLTTAGAFLAGMPLAAGLFVAAGAGIALTEIDNKLVRFSGLHGHILYEMFLSTDSGKREHSLPKDHLFNNLNATLGHAGEPLVPRDAFDQALAYVVSLKILVIAAQPNTVKWGETAVEF